MSNLGFINKQVSKIPNNQLPLFARNYPNTPPPSMSVGNVGFTKSPFSQDIGAITRFLSNKVVKPVANYTTSTINPIIDDVSQYFGYGNVSPNIIPKVPTTNISGKEIFSNIQDTGSNLINKVGGILVPSANEGEDKLINNINSGLLTNEQIVNQNNGSGTGQSLLDTNQQIINKNKEFFSGGSLTDVNNNTSSNTYDTPTSNDTTTNNQTVGKTTNNETVTTKQKKTSQTLGVESQDPNAEVVATPNGEGTPTNKFMDKFVNFAESEFGKDFFASWAEKSGPKVRKPQSFGSNVGSAYKDAREKQLEREKIKSTNNEQSFAYLVQDTENGKNYNASVDKNGNITVDIDGKKVPYKSDMFGAGTRITTVGNLGQTAMTRSSFYKLASDLQPLENSLTKLVKYNATVGSAPQGINKIGIEFGAMMNTMLSNGLTPEQLLQEVNQGRFQGQIGANRLEIVGGGVMTEQDAIRIINALGGDPSKITTNPEVVNALISDIIAEKYRTYENQLAIYNSQAGTGFYSNMPKKKKLEFDGRYTGYINPEVLLEMNPDNIAYFSISQMGNIDDSLLDTKAKQDAFIKRAEELGINIQWQMKKKLQK